MSTLLSELRDIAARLNEIVDGWALVGGLAVSVHAEPRSTRAIDVAIAMSARDMQEELVRKLVTDGYRNVQELFHLAPTQRLGVRVSRSTSTGLPLPIDLLFASSGIEEEITRAATKIEVFPGLEIPVAIRAHLIAMKIVSENDHDRLRDRLDLRLLLSRASESDIELARESLVLIKQRGFNRGKDLLRAFEDALRAQNRRSGE